MKKQYYYGFSALFYFVCLVSLAGLLFNAFNLLELRGSVKSISAGIAVLSGYLGTCFYCLKAPVKASDYMKKFLLSLFGFYILILLDFTLVDDSFGRNIFNILNWNRNSFREYLEESTNFIPLATVKLFVNGYINNDLSLNATIVNILGNFVAFMPLPFFICIFIKRYNGFLKIFTAVLLATLIIEFLQFIFLTGSSDIDDIILNIAGAMLFYAMSKITLISKGISKLTFGVWRSNEKEN